MTSINERWWDQMSSPAKIRLLLHVIVGLLERLPERSARVPLNVPRADFGIVVENGEVLVALGDKPLS